VKKAVKSISKASRARKQTAKKAGKKVVTRAKRSTAKKASKRKVGKKAKNSKSRR
jgi:hypothetical protein